MRICRTCKKKIGDKRPMCVSCQVDKLQLAANEGARRRKWFGETRRPARR